MCNCCFREGAFGFLSREAKLKGLSYGIWIFHTARSGHELNQGYSAAGTWFFSCLFGLRFPFISHVPILNWFLIRHKISKSSCNGHFQLKYLTESSCLCAGRSFLSLCNMPMHHSLIIFLPCLGIALRGLHTTQSCLAPLDDSP